MSLITEHLLRTKASVAYQSFQKASASEILNENKKSYSSSKVYDIFLSHAYLDAELILGVKQFFEDLSYTVYVDWIDDVALDRSKVDKSTALLLKERMKSCRSLVYAFTVNSLDSKWMPWELGFFDGYDGKVSVMPIAKEQALELDNKGVEYLAIYPFITVLDGLPHVTEGFLVQVSYKRWLEGHKPENLLKYLIK